jgi:hypothetical protein
MTTNVDVCNSILGQVASRAAVYRKHGVWCLHRVTGEAVGPGEVIIHMSGRRTRVSRGYCLESLPSSGEDTRDSRCLSTVQGFPHVGILQEMCQGDDEGYLLLAVQG